MTRTEGRVVQVLERASTQVVGRYVLDASGLGYVVPFDKKILVDIQVQPTETKGAQPGEMVTVAITRWPTPTRGPAGRIVEVLGDIDAPGVDLQVIIRKYGINDAHGDAAVAEATRLGSVVKPKDIEGRTDFRAVPTVTIDGEDARDFDDAITIERLPNGHYWLGVHIADVSHYVREGSALDKEAYERGTSVYFPERAVHMFPHELSTGLCSLNPQVDRLVQSCLMEVNAKGDVVRYELHDGVIYSDERMTYTAVDAILTQKDADDPRAYAPLVPLFELMGELFEVLNARRRRRGSIDFDLPENELVLDEAGRVSAVLASERNIAHRLIEEFMLLANETVAQHLSDHGTPSLFRIHEAPDVVKVEEFEEFISSLGHSLGACRRTACSRSTSRSWSRRSRARPRSARSRCSCCGRCRRRATTSPTSGTSAWPRRATATSRRRSAAIRTWSCTARCARSGRGSSPRSGCGSGRRSCRRRRATRPTASAGPTRPSARSSSGRRSASWPTRSARSSRAT